VVAFQDSDKGMEGVSVLLIGVGQRFSKALCFNNLTASFWKEGLCEFGCMSSVASLFACIFFFFFFNRFNISRQRCVCRSAHS
jgi:hypothetical protein